MKSGPRAPKTGAYVALLLRMSPALRKAAREAADGLGITVTEWIREAMRERLAEPEPKMNRSAG